MIESKTANMFPKQILEAITLFSVLATRSKAEDVSSVGDVRGSGRQPHLETAFAWKSLKYDLRTANDAAEAGSGLPEYNPRKTFSEQSGSLGTISISLCQGKI